MNIDFIRAPLIKLFSFACKIYGKAIVLLFKILAVKMFHLFQKLHYDFTSGFYFSGRNDFSIRRFIVVLAFILFDFLKPPANFVNYKRKLLKGEDLWRMKNFNLKIFLKLF